MTKLCFEQNCSGIIAPLSAVEQPCHTPIDIEPMLVEWVRRPVVDVCTRESAAIEPGRRLKGDDVVRALNRAKQKRELPKFLFCDNGSEFTSQAMDSMGSPKRNED
jgi:transposase InsO family protein